MRDACHPVANVDCRYSAHRPLDENGSPSEARQNTKECTLARNSVDRWRRMAAMTWVKWFAGSGTSSTPTDLDVLCCESRNSAPLTGQTTSRFGFSVDGISVGDVAKRSVQYSRPRPGQIDVYSSTSRAACAASAVRRRSDSSPP
jgi:hypothetical protein